MTQLLKGLTILWIGTFWACSMPQEFDPDDYTAHNLSSSIHLLSHDRFGISPLNIHPTSQATVRKDEIFEVWGLLWHDSSAISNDSLSNYVSYTFWIVNHDTLMGSRLRTSYHEAKMDTLIFHAIDFNGDTLRDTLVLYVNTPLQISLHSPRNDLVPFDIQNQAVRFSWSFEGVEPWETPYTTIWLATPFNDSILSHWTIHSYDSVVELDLSNLCARDTSCVFYYQIQTTVEAPISSGDDDLSKTDTLIFWSRRNDTNQARLRAKIRYQTTQFKPSCQAFLRPSKSAQKQTIPLEINANGEIISDFLDPGIYWLHAQDTMYPEFRPDSMLITLAEGYDSENWYTLTLIDRAPPQIYRPDNRLMNLKQDTLVFAFYDNGTGIDTIATYVVWGSDTIPVQNNEARIIWNSSLEWKIHPTINIIAQDIAGNQTPKCSWYLKELSVQVDVVGPTCAEVKDL